MEDLISVVITTYKRSSEVLLRALDSVLTQTYKTIEVIIVDDSPCDYVCRPIIKKEILERNDERITYVEHEVNKGACAARNTGLSIAKGNFIAFLDDDDLWYGNKLEEQIDKIREENIGLVYCRSFIVNELTETKKLREITPYTGFVFDKLIVSNFIGSTSFPLIKRECFDVCGGFDESLKSAQDFDMWLRIVQRYQVEFVDKPLVEYYVHSGDAITKNPNNKIQGILSINEKYSEYLSNNRKLWSIRLTMLIPYYLQIGDRKSAINLHLNSLRLSPFRVKAHTKECIRIILSYFPSAKNHKGE